MQRDSLTPYLWMMQACLVFTAMGEFAHALKESCPWQLIACFRAGLVLLFVALYTRLQGKRVFILGTATLWLRSIAGSLSMVCTFYALTRLPVSATLTLTNMFPIWVALLSWPLLGERPSVGLGVAIASGCVGVWLIQQPHFGTNTPAIVAAMAASVFTAVAMLGINRLRGLDPQTIVVHFSAVAFFFCLGAWFLFDRRPDELVSPLRVGGFLLGIGVTAAVGQILLTRAFAAGNPSRIAVVSLCQILFALVPDMLIFGHRLDTVSLLGIVFIAAPTAWVMLHPPRLTPPVTPPGQDPQGSRPPWRSSPEPHPTQAGAVLTVQRVPEGSAPDGATAMTATPQSASRPAPPEP